MTDSIGICPKCGCDGCYILPINETKNSYNCFGCGFYTNDMMIEGEYDREEYEKELPELYKDLVYVDSDRRCWYPQTVNTEEGIAFISGTSSDSWNWTAIKKVPLTDEEKTMARYKNQTHKSDPKSLKHFENDFIESLDYIGVFNKKD